MTTSSGSSSGVRPLSVASTTPAGTIIQMARGVFNFFTKSSSEFAPTAPSLASDCTASG